MAANNATDDAAEVDWDKVGYVISSKYRIAVLEVLESGPTTPTGIAEETDLGITHISRALGRLYDRDVIELVVPEDKKKGRLYALTEKGERVANHLEEVA